MEGEINGPRVVYRKKFPAKAGWDLMGAVRRLDNARRRAVQEADSGASFMSLVMGELSYEEAVAFVRGAVEEWDFPGDPDGADCCDGLDPLTELLPLVTDSVLLFYTASSAEKLQGEAVSGSTSQSEG